MAREAKKNANYGKGAHQIDSLSGDLWLNPDWVAGKIWATLQAPGYKPPVLPAVALELVQLTANAEVPLAKIRGVIQSEPMLAAQLLGSAQSAYYARGNPITSLDDAIARLGYRVIGDLFLQAALTTRVFRAPGYEVPMQRLRVHSVVCANVARLICRRTGFPDDYAFMCGLLHDVGMAAAIAVLADAPRGASSPSYDVVKDAVERIHESATTILGRFWSLPEDVQLVLAHHHHFEISGKVHPLAAAICLADAIAAQVGAGAGNEVDVDGASRAAAFLGLSAADVEGLALAGENFIGLA